MYLRLISANVLPDKIQEARELAGSEEVNSTLKLQKGFRFHYLLESLEKTGEIIAVTGWDSKADADIYEQSGTFDRLHSQFGKWFTYTPELKTYEVNSYLECK